MTLSKEQFQKYIFEEAHDDRSRLVIQHETYKDQFDAIFERVLNEFGLRQTLEKAKANHEKVSILDAGCGEGLYMHDVADILDKYGLTEAVTLIGVDRDNTALFTAQQYSKLSNPPRPYLEFFAHDLTTPLETNLGLKAYQNVKFDFIYAVLVMEHLPNAKTCLAYLYDALKPGGIIYLRDIVTQEGENGWIAPHPAIAGFYRGLFAFLNQLNSGIELATTQVDWLREFGAELLESKPYKITTGDASQMSLKALRNWVMVARNSLPILIARNVISQAQADQLMQVMFHELKQDSTSQLTLIDTIAQKPH